MKTDSYWLSLAWGRMGAALLVLIGVALGAYGIDFSADTQSEVYGIVASTIAGIGGLFAVWSKLREQYRSKKMGPTSIEPAPMSQSGRASMKSILILFLLGMLAIFAFSGCANMQHPTATQQIMKQTNDPMTVSLAVYHDGLKLYFEAQELYKPYQEFIKEANPEIDTEIIGYFREARKVLTDWKKFGALPGEDEKTFREALRDISLTIARYKQAKS